MPDLIHSFKSCFVLKEIITIDKSMHAARISIIDTNILTLLCLFLSNSDFHLSILLQFKRLKFL